jgi:murein DD-endopeptidase MepM/ murein hydrolase activator NlpD
MRSPRDLRLRVRYIPEESVLPIRQPRAVLAGLLTVWAALLFLHAQRVPYPLDAATFVPVTGPVVAMPKLPQPWPQSVAVDADRAVSARFASGSTLDGTFRRAGLSGSNLTEMIDVVGAAVDVRRVRPGQEYQLYFDAAGELIGFRYQVERQAAWFVARRNDAWEAAKVAIPIESRRAYLSAEIVDSLHRAIATQTPSRGSVNDLVSKVGDIYGWDVDFQYDLRYGDRLDLLVEERYVEGKFIGYGEILAAEFQVNGRVLPVVRFRDPDGNGSYFAPDGSSLRRAFLRSPVKYSRISSRFSNRRVHPVTGVARAHRGVDYAADPGTPVQATADGVVAEARYGAEPGRYVKLRHGGSYSSVYMHLSRIESGIAPGTEVKQGQVIGYVGKTGNATGYHLHYGLEQGSAYVDPMRLQFPAASPVPSDHWGRFVAQRDAALETLREGQAGRAAAVAGAGAGL